MCKFHGVADNREGAITKPRNVTGWKDMEQYKYHTTKANQQWFPQHKETTRNGDFTFIQEWIWN